MIPQENEKATEDLDFLLKSDDEVLDKESLKAIRKGNKRKRKKKLLALIPIILGVILFLLLITYLILHAIGKNQMLDIRKSDIKISEEITEQEGAASEDDGKTITYQGETYILNENITTILCMGIDKTSIDSQGYGSNGQADANFLLVVDTKRAKATAIAINRDTMVDTNIYSDSGIFLGAEEQQLCLAFAAGDGKDKSAQNMKKCVSNLLYGIPVNSHIAIDLKAIGILNELVGGVTVTSPETFTTGYGVSFEKGKTYTLSTQQEAESYVRYRNVAKLESNVARITRQKDYLKGFAKSAVKKTKESLTFPLTLYNEISGYNINDLNAAKITFLTSCLIRGRENVNLTFKNIEGEVTMGETHAEFRPDKEKLFELILEVFYDKQVS